MHAMNASSLHLWLNFYSSLKCYHSYNCSLKTVPVAWTCTLQVYAKFLGFSGVLSVWGQIWRTWTFPWVIIQTPWSWCSLLTGAVLMALYFISLPGLSCSTKLFLGYSWIWQQLQACGCCCKIQPVVITGWGECSSYPDISIPLPPSHPYTHDFLIYFCSLLPGELTMNLRKGVENACRSS